MLTIILIVATVMAIGLFYLMVAGSGDRAPGSKRNFLFKSRRTRADHN